MSIGNLRDNGNKGNNFPWQLAVLKLLESISSAISGSIASQVRTPNFLRASGSTGTIPAGAYAISFASVGSATAVVGGVDLKPGEIINLDAGTLNNTLAGVNYSTLTVGSELLITYLT